jgi:hypothetical protein
MLPPCFITTGPNHKSLPVIVMEGASADAVVVLHRHHGAKAAVAGKGQGRAKTIHAFSDQQCRLANKMHCRSCAGCILSTGLP